MGWEALIPLIVQYGLPFVESLVQKWESKAAPTAVDFAELRSLMTTTAGQLAAKQIAASPLAGTSAGAALQHLAGN